MKTDIPIGSVVMHISFPHRLGIVIGSEQCWNRKLGRGYMKYWIDWIDICRAPAGALQISTGWIQTPARTCQTLWPTSGSKQLFPNQFCKLHLKEL